jgi:DNA-binding CsgD family transcriptional regulator
MARGMAAEVIGREEELGSIEAFLARIRGGPGALVLSGEPGIGKTVLWEAGVEEARRTLGRVLVHRSAEAEAALSFTGLSDLLVPVFEDVAAELAPLRRRALEVALLLVEPGKEAPDPRAIALALLDVLRMLAQQGPVVLALDDLQWVDPSSAGALQMALRRLQDERVAVLATVRTAPDTTVPAELDRAFPPERLVRLLLGPLSIAALHHLLRERVGLELTRPELVRVQEASVGNPFFALELGRELVRTGSRPTAGKALPVPDSLYELLGGRLARLPTDTGDVVLFAAALARPTVDLVVAAHGQRETVVEALGTAAREGVIELDDSHLRFAHPLLASICYEQAPIWKRRAIHGALARAVTDVEERARHMALSVDGPDAVAASYLDAAAEQAAARGATAAAAELCELAADLTLGDPALERQRRLGAAKFHRLAGSGAHAVLLLEQILTEVPEGLERSDVLFELASTLRADPQTTIERLDEALENAAGDEVRGARILAYRGWIRIFLADIDAALVDTRAALEKAERIGDPALIAATIGHVAIAEGRAGDFTPGLVERGVEIEQRLALQLQYNESPSVSLSRRLAGQGELDRARALLEEIETKAAARGDERLRAQAHGARARIEWFAGNWQLALDLATEAREFHPRIQHEVGLLVRLKALAEADLGLVEQARASAEDARMVAEEMSDREWAILSVGVLGRLEFALDHLDAALGYVRELPQELLARGYKDPTAPVWGDAIEILIAGGEHEQARVYLTEYELNSSRAESPWALAVASRCRGLLASAEDDQAAALAAFERSLTQLEGLPYPFERGRTLLCLGTVRRQAQQRRAAREALEGALAIFEELGARLWAEKARAELRRISGRRTSSEELTETERRVAELAGRGHTNKEIAAELYMGVSTVEAHLSRVYRKLGLRSRTELAGRISPREDASKLVDEGAQV